MKTLAEISFEYIFLSLFGTDTQIDPDYAESVQQTLPEYFSQLNEEEQKALIIAAQNVKDRLLADPDEYGYTTKDSVGDDVKDFLDSFIDGMIFEQFQ